MGPTSRHMEASHADPHVSLCDDEEVYIFFKPTPMVVRKINDKAPPDICRGHENMGVISKFSQTSHKKCNSYSKMCDCTGLQSKFSAASPPRFS